MTVDKLQQPEVEGMIKYCLQKAEEAHIAMRDSARKENSDAAARHQGEAEAYEKSAKDFEEFIPEKNRVYTVELTLWEIKSLLMASIFGGPDKPHEGLESAKRKLKYGARVKWPEAS